MKTKTKNRPSASVPQEHKDNSLSGAPIPKRDTSSPVDGDSRGWRIFLSDWGIRLGILGIALTVICAVPSFLPRVEIAKPSSESAQPSLPAPFSVTNNGFLSMHKVEIVCRLDSVNNLKGEGGMRNLGITTPKLQTPLLSPPDSFEFACPFTKMFKIKEPLARVDMNVVVSFRPSFSLFRSVRCARFIADADEGGTFHWEKRPTEVCAMPGSIFLYTGP